jgi:hypothetical protein
MTSLSQVPEGTHTRRLREKFVEDVLAIYYDETALKAFIADEYAPEEVYSEGVLGQWAREHGFVEEE